MSNRKLFVILVVVGTGIWVALGAATFLLGSVLEPDPGVGLLGDMFGGASSLFAAFGALGVVFALNRDRIERRVDLGREDRDRAEAIRPFVTFDVERVRVDEARFVDGTYRFEAGFDAALANATETPALNLTVHATLRCAGDVHAAEVQVDDGPLHVAGQTSASREAGVNFIVAGEPAKALARAFKAESKVRLLVEIQYTSVSNVPWMTKVEFDLNCGNGKSRQVLDDSLASGSVGLARGVGADDAVFIELLGVPGSWKHEMRPIT